MQSSCSAYLQNLRSQFCQFPSIGGVPEGRGGLKDEIVYESEYENKNEKACVLHTRFQTQIRSEAFGGVIRKTRTSMRASMKIRTAKNAFFHTRFQTQTRSDHSRGFTASLRYAALSVLCEFDFGCRGLL